MVSSIHKHHNVVDASRDCTPWCLLNEGHANSAEMQVGASSKFSSGNAENALAHVVMC